VKASDLRPGKALMFDGKLYIVTQFQHVTPGNLRAFVQLKCKCVTDGSTVEKRLRSTEEVEQAFLDRREMEYLYTDSSGLVLMDSETYDQISIPTDLVGDATCYLLPNTKVTALVTGGNVISVELPKTVDLKVTETTPAIKGATATNQMKEAGLETGLKTRVPPFINIGEVVRISTEDGSYLSRA
jgi:elongation factor P